MRPEDRGLGIGPDNARALIDGDLGGGLRVESGLGRREELGGAAADSGEGSGAGGGLRHIVHRGASISVLGKLGKTSEECKTEIGSQPKFTVREAAGGWSRIAAGAYAGHPGA